MAFQEEEEGHQHMILSNRLNWEVNVFARKQSLVIQKSLFSQTFNYFSDFFLLLLLSWLQYNANWYCTYGKKICSSIAAPSTTPLHSCSSWDQNTRVFTNKTLSTYAKTILNGTETASWFCSEIQHGFTDTVRSPFWFGSQLHDHNQAKMFLWKVSIAMSLMWLVALGSTTITTVSKNKGNNRKSQTSTVRICVSRKKETSVNLVRTTWKSKIVTKDNHTV